VGTPRAQLGHSSNGVLIEFDDSAVISFCSHGLLDARNGFGRPKSEEST
jgi:hypothetical protein